MRDNVFPPGLRGYVATEQLGQNNRAQNLGMLAQLMQMQGQMQDRQLQQQMMPLKLQGMLAELEAQKEKAAHAQDKRAFFSPQNQQQYMEGGRPEIALPDDMQGPRQAAEPGQMNFDRFLQDAATRGHVNPETYANHLGQRENARAKIESDAQAKMFQLQQQKWQIEQTINNQNLNREQKAELAAQRAALDVQLKQMSIDNSRALAQFAVANRAPAAAPPVTPVTIADPNDPNKTLIVDGRTKQVIGAGPKATDAGKVGAGGVRLSPTAQKEVFEADDAVAGGTQAIENLQKASEINKNAWGFWGAGAASKVGTLLPEGARKNLGVDVTRDFDNLIQGSALPQLKQIFAGNPTEGERKILLELAGSSNESPEVRTKILERAITAAQRRVKLHADRGQQLRGGTYFTPQGGGQAPSAPAAAPTVRKYNPATGRIE
jgi:hypothetical protein